MKKTIQFLAILFLLGNLIACDNSSTTQNSEDGQINSDIEGNTDSEDVEEDNASEVITLSGAYASNTRLPLAQNSVYNLFDNDAKTQWSTPVGAGLDEGIMLYFDDSPMINSMTIDAATGEGIAGISNAVLYVNGVSIGGTAVNEPIIIDNDVRSLYIRFSDVEDTETKKDGKLSTTKMKENQRVVINDLSFTGEKGAIKVIAPTVVSGKIKASSTLEPETAYGTHNLFDNHKDFAWIEGAKSSGQNETIEFILDEAITIDHLELWNGYRRSKTHLTANARAASISFGLKGQDATNYDLEGENEKGSNYIKLEESLTGEHFIMTITGVEEGTSYKDLGISELRFWNDAELIIMNTVQGEQYQKALKAKVQGNVLGKILDRRVFNSIGDSERRSLIIRSNYTFVMYESEEGEADSKNVIADGNWELVKAGTEEVTIKVFGKYMNVAPDFEYYKGEDFANSVKIFKDNLTIKSEGKTSKITIKGEKFIDIFTLF